MRLPESMTLLGRALQPVMYQHARGELRAEVPPPTVRQWVEIRTAVVEAATGEEADMLALMDLLEEWLPPEVVADLLLMEPVAMLRTVVQLLDAHARRVVPPGDSGDAAPGTGKEWDIRAALWDWCAIAGGADPWQVYNSTPWPFFLALSAVRDAAAARNALRAVEVELVPHVGKHARKVIDDLRRRAGITAEPVADCAPPEVIERDREILVRMFGVRRDDAGP